MLRLAGTRNGEGAQTWQNAVLSRFCLSCAVLSAPLLADRTASKLGESLSESEGKQRNRASRPHF